jgi:hypothetical protein
MRVLRSGAGFGLLLSLLSVSGLAGGQSSVEACASAYAKGQEDRLAGRLFNARAAFQVCAEAACPAAIARDCAHFQAEVEQDLPTVRLRVTDVHGARVEQLRVFADGASVPETSLARPIILEAGPHVLRFEAKDCRPVEVTSALRPTDRELEIAVVLHRPSEPLPSAPKPISAPEAANSGARGVPALAVALAGLGAVALGGSLYFGLRSHEQYEDLKASCAPMCNPSQADAVRSNALISDVALLTGAAALGSAAWVYFSARPAQPSIAAVNVAPSAHGAGVRLRVAF